MKRLTGLGSIVLVCVLLLAACSVTAQESELTYESFDGKTVVIFATPVEFTPEDMEMIIGVKVGEIITVPSISEALAALRSGRADCMFISLSSAEYLCQADSSLGYVAGNDQESTLTMLTRAEDAELTQRINAAIDTLNEQGVVEELMAKTTQELLSGNLVSIDALEELEGDETLLVGVSGDLPPLDFISTEGNPAGFNAAYMHEIAKQMGVKVEFVLVPTSTKFAALLSGRIDTFLWHASWTSGEEISASNVYYTTGGAVVYVK